MKDVYSKYVVWDDNNVKGFFEDYRYLSNFEICPRGVRLYTGDIFESTENAYQFAKHYLHDVKGKFTEEQYVIWSHDRAAVYLMSPAESKKWGRNIQVRKNWDKIKYDVMMQLVFDKFWRDLKLRKQLIGTGDKHLEELNHWRDEIWGVNCWTGKGTNWLGEILMKVRGCLK